MKYVSQEELTTEIRKVKTQTAVSFIAETPASLRSMAKTAPYMGAVKTNKIVGMMGFDYEVSVNNQLGREDKSLDFKAQGRRNDIRNTDCPSLKIHANGTLYIWVKVTSAETPTYTYNGNDVTEAIKPYLKDHNKPRTQDNIDKEVVGRTYKVANIISMKMMGEEYAVTEHLTTQERETVERIAVSV